MSMGPVALSQTIRNILNERFRIQERGSTISTEVFAGIITYLSLSFVFILNPAILGSAPADSHGVFMSPASILTATVITSAVATVLMGIFANLPLAVGPGIEVSAFFTYVLVRQMALSWEEALLAVVVSGVLNVILTAFSVRRLIVEAIPAGLKASLLLTIGVFVLLVGLKLGNIVDVEKYTVPLFLNASFWSRQSFLSGPFILIVGLLISATLNIRRLRLPWGTLVGIISAATACHLVGGHPNVHAVSTTNVWTQTFFKAFGRDATHAIFKWSFWSGVVIMFVIDFVGGISKIYALTEGTQIPRHNDRVPGLKEALFVDGAATIAGGALGTSSLIAFVESRIGIEAGGQTGLMAVVCGLLMAAGGIFSGLLILIPPQAASGVLIYVGFLLISLNVKLLKEHALGRVDFGIAALMAILVLATFQFDYAMLAGFLAYFVRAYRQGIPLRSIFWLGLVALFLLMTVLPDLASAVGLSRRF
jgi:AGZA family xanthine/uracil permease-like MFS transporter